ncbi:hypothetical protein Btru_015109 [Bulinus truncatus]|nr:hypothetical protein Btru_015109 [Bulinus truncatus]
MEALGYAWLVYCLLFTHNALMGYSHIVSSSRTDKVTGEDKTDILSPDNNIPHSAEQPPDPEMKFFYEGHVSSMANSSYSTTSKPAGSDQLRIQHNQTSHERVPQHHGHMNHMLSASETMGSAVLSSHTSELVDGDVHDYLSKLDLDSDDGYTHDIDYHMSSDVMLGFGDEPSEDHDDDGSRRSKSKKRPEYNRADQERNLMLHEAVRNLLGFSQQRNPHQPRGHILPDQSKARRLPEYVQDLYRRFQSGEMTAGLVHGNTIRSIHTKVGTVEGEPMFLFNLTSLRPSETMVSAEIHLYRRKLKPWLRRPELEIILHQVAPHYISLVGKITLRESAVGWQWYDVTNAVKSCLASGKQPSSNVFGLSFRKHRPNGISKPVLLRKFGKHHSMPFLVVYSNETEAVNLSQLDLLVHRLHGSNDHEVANDSNSELNDSQSSHDNVPPIDDSLRSRHLPAKSTNLLPDNFRSQKSESKPKLINEHRKRRSLLTNEIPEDSADTDTFRQRNNIPKTHPGILKSRQDYRLQSGKSGIIPFPEHYLQRKKQRKKLRKKHRQQSADQYRKRFPKDWSEFRVLPQSDKSKTCDRKMLLVDFADIGWADWIISPKSFEAHYCAGECPFPLSKQNTRLPERCAVSDRTDYSQLGLVQKGLRGGVGPSVLAPFFKYLQRIAIWSATKLLPSGTRIS